MLANGAQKRHTLVLVNSENDDNLVLANLDVLLNGSDSSSGKLRKENHTFDVTVLQEFHYNSLVPDSCFL